MAKITFSAGISEYLPDMTSSEIIGYADQALYQAKNDGRNRVRIYKNAL